MNKTLRVIVTCLMISLFFPFAVVAATEAEAAEPKKKKLTPEDVIQRHLESLGAMETLSARKSLKAEGTALMEVVTSSGALQGPATFLSDGDKLRMSIVFDDNTYPEEEIAYNGKGVETSYTRPGVRSRLGQFLYDFDEILSEGLFGGALSTSWSLLDLENRSPKLKYEGEKKLDGQKYHTVRYRRRKGGDVETRLYFDTEAFRHRHTIYKVKISSPILGRRDGASASQPETWYILKESFTNFQSIVKLTLPTRWILEFTTEMGRRGSVLRFTTQYVTMGTGRIGAIAASEFDLN